MSRVSAPLARLVCTLFAVASAAGCGGVAGSGRVVSQDRTYTPFQRIEVRGSASVKVVSGAGALSVITDDNLLPYVTTQIVGDRLIVDEREHRSLFSALYPSSGIEVQVTTPEPILSASLSGSGSLESLDKIANSADKMQLRLSGSGSSRLTLAGSAVEADLSGSGSLRLDGTVTNGRFTTAGSGSVNAFDLSLTTATAEISGSGSMHLAVSESLDATLRGSGSVIYSGSPLVTEKRLGSGSVSRVR